MESFFNPRVVAGIGVSTRPDKLGHILADNLREATSADIFFVNPASREILGRPCYPTVDSLPAIPDLAVIAVAAPQVIDTLRSCASIGVPAAVILAAGFAETGATGARMQEVVTSICRDHGIRVIGPNTSGLYNCNTKLCASIAYKSPPGGGRISFMTQSGAAVLTYQDYANDHGLRFAKLVDYGNQADVEDYEILQYLGGDPDTGIISVFLEVARSPERLLDAARAVTSRKPVIIGRTARTAAGARAALAHTGMQASGAKWSPAACRRAGVIYARHMLDVAQISKALDWQPLPQGRRVGIVSGSGGMAVELADACAENGLLVRELGRTEQEAIRPLMPSFASSKNPIDMGPIYARFPEAYSRCIEVLYDSPDIDIILLTIADRGAAHLECLHSIARTVQTRQSEGAVPKPIYVYWASQRAALSNQAILETARIPCFEHGEVAVRVAGAVSWYASYLRKRLVERVENK